MPQSQANVANAPNASGVHRLVNLQIIHSELGILGVAEASKQVGFDVKRIYFITDVPANGRRGGHAHKQLKQCLIALRGSVTLDLTQQGRTETVVLDDYAKALVLSPGCWRDMRGFSSDALLLVLASSEFEESDYIRDFADFLAWELDQAAKPVPYLDLSRYAAQTDIGIQPTATAVINAGTYVGGSEVSDFETGFAAYCGCQTAVGLGNGLEALSCTLKAWSVGPGDEVISPAHTFVATALAVSETGATPVLVDVDEDTGLMDPAAVAAAMSSRTRAILPVHLYGHPVDMDAIREVVGDILILEDACQAHGALYKGRRCGSLGDAAAFSFYPSKNLGALGDGGAMTTDDTRLAERVRRLGNYGSDVKYRHEELGFNSRLDSLQAAILSKKLPRLDAWNDRRRDLADMYHSSLAGIDGLLLPTEKAWARSVWHVFPVRVAPGVRDEFATFLRSRQIGVNIHYPIPVHEQPCYSGQWKRGQFPVAERWAQSVLSLPLDATHSDSEIDRVIQAVRAYFGAR